jgi:hypothetical protein
MVGRTRLSSKSSRPGGGLGAKSTMKPGRPARWASSASFSSPRRLVVVPRFGAPRRWYRARSRRTRFGLGCLAVLLLLVVGIVACLAL